MGHQYRVRIGGTPHALHDLEDEPLTALLRSVHAQRPKPEITCACRRDARPLRLVVFNRGNGYFLRRHVDDSGDDHGPHCRHHTPSEQRLAESGYTRDVLKVGDDSEIRVALDFALGVKDPTPSATATATQDAQSRDKSLGTRATLLGLLHLLWEQAGLARFEGRVAPNWSPWRQLAGAASRVHPNAMRALSEHGLLDLLLLPARSATFQKKANFARLRDACEKRRVLFACVLTPQLLNERTERGSVDLYPELQVPLYVPGEMIDRYLASSRGDQVALRTGGHVVLFGLASGYRRKNGFAAAAERVVTMQTTAHCVPVASVYERRLAEYLEATGRVFTKPLRYDASEEGQPDFVLLDAGAEVPLEVYGMSAADYLARKAAKTHYYAARFPGAHWAWDAITESFEDAVARLPAPGSLKP